MGDPIKIWEEAVVHLVAGHAGIDSMVHSLIIDGISSSVVSVLVFLPIIVTLFFFLSIWEDTGYMARVVSVIDKPCGGPGYPAAASCPCSSASVARCPPSW